MAGRAEKIINTGEFMIEMAADLDPMDAFASLRDGSRMVELGILDRGLHRWVQALESYDLPGDERWDIAIQGTGDVLLGATAFAIHEPFRYLADRGLKAVDRVWGHYSGRDEIER